MSGPDPTVARIIDANLNRAREALRVMEEYARFVLDDYALTAAIKEARHELAAAGRRVGEDGERCEDLDDAARTARADPRGSGLRGEAEMIAHRDIAGDVGRNLAGPAEYERSDAGSVVVAAGKRLSEALRAIEEYGKTFDPGLARGVEGIRYRGYDLERRVILTARARERFGEVRLYVILIESLCSGGWFETAEAALRGGADCIQLREKKLNDGELLDRAKRLVTLCRDSGRILIVNDRPDIAVVSRAHGVHLGQEDISVAAARRIVPATCIVGVSTHNIEQVKAAVAAAPDYIAVGPMFATTTKPQEHIAGPETLAAARSLTSIPLAAIGGIDADNAAIALAGRRCCVCACTSVISQSDVAEAAARLRALVDRAWAEKVIDV